jgi:serine/threonine-protein kinase
LLLVLSCASALLALFQWMELLIVRGGGTAICAINETVSCQQVWDSAFASRIHTWTGVPVAGWGLVWAFTCFVLSVLWVRQQLAGQTGGTFAAALKWSALAGVFASFAFAAASARAGAVCLTCIGTYLLAFAFAGAAFRFLPEPGMPRGRAGRDGVFWAAGLTVLGFGLVLFPGLRTPHATESNFLKNGKVALNQLVQSLSPPERQLLSDAIDEYRRAPTSPLGPQESRLRLGPPDASVRIIEFTDILCPHCRHFNESLSQVRKVLPPGAVSVEPRQYPLDAKCNVTLTPPPSGEERPGADVRCLAAKVLVCLEGSGDYERISEELFASQNDLTPEKVMEMGSSGSMKGPALAACVSSDETRGKLTEDAQLAQTFHIRGTPLVVVNGREALAAPIFLYALGLAGGDVEMLRSLPLPPAREPQAP